MQFPIGKRFLDLSSAVAVLAHGSTKTVSTRGCRLVPCSCHLVDNARFGCRFPSALPVLTQCLAPGQALLHSCTCAAKGDHKQHWRLNRRTLVSRWDQGSRAIAAWSTALRRPNVDGVRRRWGRMLSAARSAVLDAQIGTFAGLLLDAIVTWPQFAPKCSQ